LLRALTDELTGTFVVVTHDAQLVSAADAVLRVVDGAVRQRSTPKIALSSGPHAGPADEALSWRE
jgi:ABC-type lipoprotein export system ATPase subunit